MRNIIISVIFILFAFGCSKVENNKFETTESFIRDWKVVRYPYSNATLTLLNNNEFKYEETGHITELYSEGIWNKKGDTLMINSLRPNKCLYVDDFSLNNEDTFEAMVTTINNCLPEPNAKMFTEFSNEKFIIKKDSLIYLNLNKDYKQKYGNYKIY